MNEESSSMENSWHMVDNLSTEQKEIKKEAIYFIEEKINNSQKGVFIIEGQAGTGKSVLVTALFEKIQESSKEKTSKIYGTKNFVLVNHPEMLKFYKRVAGKSDNLLKKNFERPTTFINRCKKEVKYADVVIVDEAHLLLTKRDSYNHFDQENQLEEILKYAKVVILIFDNKQVLKAKSYWSTEKLMSLLKGTDIKIKHLRQQFRIEANSAVKEWITAFCEKEILKLPSSQNFDFRIMDDANEMYQLIRMHNENVGTSRVLATYDFPYRLDGKDYFVNAGNLQLRWDRSKPQEKLAWAEREDTIDEVGSVYTIQGFDLNYAGIILGPSVGYDKVKEELILYSEFYEDQAAFNGVKLLGINQMNVKERLMLNAMNVLLTRPKKGLYIYAVNDDLRKRLLR